MEVSAPQTLEPDEEALRTNVTEALRLVSLLTVPYQIIVVFLDRSHSLIVPQLFRLLTGIRSKTFSQWAACWNAADQRHGMPICMKKNTLVCEGWW